MSPQRIACLIAITAFEPMSIWVIPFHWMGGGPLARPAPESRRRARNHRRSVLGFRPLPSPSTLDSLLRPLRLLLRQWLRLQPADSLVRQQDLVGLTGEVLLGCHRDQRGLVRLRVRDCWIDARAYGSDERPLLRGDRALVLHHQDDHLWVTRLEATYPWPSP